MVKCSSLLQIIVETAADTQFVQLSTRLLERSLLYTGQDLQTFGGRGVHAIVHKGQRYLAFANFYKSNYNIDSFVYKLI